MLQELDPPLKYCGGLKFVQGQKLSKVTGLHSAALLKINYFLG